MSFYERYALCCQNKGIAPVSQVAADAMGCTKATISAFAKNGTTPKGDTVARAAMMLDVSADYQRIAHSAILTRRRRTNQDSHTPTTTSHIHSQYQAPQPPTL